MVSFLRDVMIVVAIVASLFALALYPGQESGSHSATHSIPVSVAPASVTTTAARADAPGSGFEKRP